MHSPLLSIDSADYDDYFLWDDQWSKPTYPTYDDQYNEPKYDDYLSHVDDREFISTRELLIKSTRGNRNELTLLSYLLFPQILEAMTTSMLVTTTTIVLVVVKAKVKVERAKVEKAKVEKAKVVGVARGPKDPKEAKAPNTVRRARKVLKEARAGMMTALRMITTLTMVSGRV
jgi:hypothetical protein